MVRANITVQVNRLWPSRGPVLTFLLLPPGVETTKINTQTAGLSGKNILNLL